MADNLGNGGSRQWEFYTPPFPDRCATDALFLFYDNGLFNFFAAKIDLNKEAVIFCHKVRSQNRQRKNQAAPGGSNGVRERLVKKPNLQKPSKVERARARLDGAVARLEAAINQRAQSLSGEHALDAPSGAILQELEGLRDENARLKALNETVSGRPETAIGRLRSAIGE